MLLLTIAWSLLSPSYIKADIRECARPERWAASMAQTHLKNAGILKNEEIDFTKTRVDLLASEETKKGIYHQVQKITFFKKDRKKIVAITENDASAQECSEGVVTVYVVERTLGP